MKQNLLLFTLVCCMQTVFSQNVGIGIKSPQYLLTVRDSINGSGQSFGVVSQDNSVAMGFFVSNSSAYLQTHSNHDLLFATNNATTQMLLQKGTGNLGVGLTSPTARIEAIASATRVLNITQSNTGLFSANFSGTSTATAVINAVAPVGGNAARFEGNVIVTGNLTVSGSVSKSSGTFKIDHPLDPANKYLIHSFVESPDMMNVYNGNITTNANGMAVVELPAYFEAANKDCKYQLTVIGQFAQAIISKKVANNRFEIMTDKPNVEVSWQVTGVRNDPYAKQNRILPEVEKQGEEKGYYISPEAYGLSRERALGSILGVEKK